MNARAKIKVAAPVNEEREILLALFNPETEHKDGCLFKGNRNLPCQCGYAEIQHRYNWALRRVKEIAASVHGSAWEKPLQAHTVIDNTTVRATACADDIRAQGWTVTAASPSRSGLSHTLTADGLRVKVRQTATR